MSPLRQQRDHHRRRPGAAAAKHRNRGVSAMKIVAAKKILKANDQLAAENRARLDAAGVFGAERGRLARGRQDHAPGSPLRPVRRPPPAGRHRRRHRRLDRRRTHGEDRRARGANQHRRRLPPRRPHGGRRRPRARSSRRSICWPSKTWATWCAPPASISASTCGSWSSARAKATTRPSSIRPSSRAPHALVITKIDLLPHLNFNVERITADMKRLAPAAAVFQVSAIRGDGIPEVADWLVEKCRKERR